MGDVGQEFALGLAGALHRLRHAVERLTGDADLIGSAQADAARVVAAGDVLGGVRELGQRPRQGPADQQADRDRHQHGDSAGGEQERQQGGVGLGVDGRAGAGQHHVLGAQRVTHGERGVGLDAGRRCDVGLAADVHGQLVHLVLAVYDAGARGVGSGHRAGRPLAVVDHAAAAGNEQETVAVEAGADGGVEAIQELIPRSQPARQAGAAAVGDRQVGGAFAVPDLLAEDDRLPVQLVAGILELEVADQVAREDAADHQ